MECKEDKKNEVILDKLIRNDFLQKAGKSEHISVRGVFVGEKTKQNKTLQDHKSVLVTFMKQKDGQ